MWTNMYIMELPERYGSEYVAETMLELIVAKNSPNLMKKIKGHVQKAYRHQIK